MECTSGYSGYFNVLSEKKTYRQCEWSLINYPPEIRLPREFNELNILSPRYIRLTYNKYDLAPGIREFRVREQKKNSRIITKSARATLRKE